MYTQPLFRPIKQGVCRAFSAGFFTLPRAELVLLSEVSGGVVNGFGASCILFQVGDASNWLTAAEWGFEYSAELAAIDTLLGGGVLFTGTTPIYRTWSEWFFLDATNVDYLWIGLNGIAIYDVDHGDSALKINSYLSEGQLEMLEDLEMLENLGML